MKITFVLPSIEISGGIRVVSIYAELLKKRGHEIFLVSTPHPKPSLRQQIRSFLKREELTSSKPHPSFFDDLDIHYHVIESYRPITDRDLPDADVVVATWWETAEWVAALSARKGAKAYFIQHHEVFDYLPRDRVNATWTLPLHKIMVAQWLVDIAEHHFKDRDVSLVPNAVDPTKFYSDPRKKQRIPTFGVMHKDVPWKGCDVSYAAFEMAKATIPDLKLLAFGVDIPGACFPNGAEFIQFPDQEQLRSLYSRCDAWLFGSRFEGFGLPLLEAMACRTPVVGTRTGAAPDLIQEDAGVLVDIDDVAAMADGIIRIAQMSEAEWKLISDCAYNRAISTTWDDTVIMFEQALRRAIVRTKEGSLEPLTCRSR